MDFVIHLCKKCKSYVWEARVDADRSIGAVRGR